MAGVGWERGKGGLYTQVSQPTIDRMTKPPREQCLIKLRPESKVPCSYSYPQWRGGRRREDCGALRGVGGLMGVGIGKDGDGDGGDGGDGESMGGVR